MKRKRNISHLKIGLFAATLVGLFLTLEACNTTEKAQPTHTTGRATIRPSLLVIGLDGIPYHVMQDLQKRGLFQQFKPVTSMVASFPSISDPNWNRLLDMPTADSYTKTHFDPTFRGQTDGSDNGSEGRIEGSLLDHVSSVPPYETGFDYRVEGLVGHVANLTWLKTSARLWIDDLDVELMKLDNRKSFYAFTLNTDLLAHTEGRHAIESFLEQLEKKLIKIQKFWKDNGLPDPEIVLISDHGNTFLPPQIIDFEKTVEERGWHRKDTLENARDYAFVAPEILSFGAFYTRPNAESHFAEDISKIKGVLLAAHVIKKSDLSQGSNLVLISVVSARGSLQIEVDPKTERVQIRVTQGRDPLEHPKSMLSKWIKFEAYFSETHDSQYPYAAVRIWESLKVNALKPASVVVSALPGFAFSNPTLELLTAVKGLRSLHGGLGREETLGIFMSTKKILTPIRPQDFRNFIDLEEFRLNVKRTSKH